MEIKKDIKDKSILEKKWNCFFAFYRISFFYKLWLIMCIISVFILLRFDLPFMLTYMGSYIISAVASLIIFAIIVFTAKDVFINATVDTNNAKGPSAQTMRMLRRNIRRRWF